MASFKKITEDQRLRPFLSPLFDSQSYTKSVIKDGKSEECFKNVVHCIDDVNLEIKGYISVHKDDLMSGMQDVAALADRYTSLSATSQKLHRNIDRLKKETFESHELVSTRTLELERIHTTSIILHQLKQFAHAKQQLDSFLSNTDEKDLRNLSNAAKTVSELEKLLENPQLLEIKFVSDCQIKIKQFGKNIRILAQDRLLTAISEKNQASIANSLQVFYNLDSLPEIIILVIDTTVKQTIDASRNALDIEGINTVLHEYMNPGSHSSATNALTGAGSVSGLIGNKSIISSSLMKATSTPASMSNSNNSSLNLLLSTSANNTSNTVNTSGNTTTTTSGSTVTASMQLMQQHAAAGGGPVSLPQLRLAMREVAHMWSNVVHDMAMQIHVFQRVVAKKEDPTTHEKFIHVLRRVVSPPSSTSDSSYSQQTTDNYSPNTLLSKGQLLGLFWHRLSLSLQDVAAEKVRAHAAASSRAYPYLRRAAIEIVQNLRNWTERDNNYHNSSSGGRSILLLSGGGGSDIYNNNNSDSSSSDDEDDDDNTDDEGIDDNDYHQHKHTTTTTTAMTTGDSTGYDQLYTTTNNSYRRKRTIKAAADPAKLFGSESTLLTSTASSTGIFGSLAWSQEDLLGKSKWNRRLQSDRNNSNNINGSRHRSNSQSDNRSINNTNHNNNNGQKQRNRTDSSSGGNGSGGGNNREHSLVQGLKPMRDKYLLNTLSRMSAPIQQMFPELDGYTAAVPSNRDLQTLIKAIQTEFSTALIESSSSNSSSSGNNSNATATSNSTNSTNSSSLAEDTGLVVLVCKEFQKTVKLMLSKIEGMVLHTAEARLITPQNQFTKTHAQQHNSQLMVLLMQFKDGLEKIPNAVLKYVADTSSTSSNATITAAAATATTTSGMSANANGTTTVSSAPSLSTQYAVNEITKAVSVTVRWINDLAQRQILDSVVNMLSGYVLSVLINIHKEGIVAVVSSSNNSTNNTATATSSSSKPNYTGKAPVNNSSNSSTIESTLECSNAVQTLVKQLPVMLKSHLFSLPKCEAVNRATEEVYIRTLHIYVTMAALLRPVNESTRLRTAKDLSALEMLLSGLYAIPQPSRCPVLQEYKAFRRLLFQEWSSSDSNSTPEKNRTGSSNTSSSQANPVPNIRELLQLPYLSQLRPSTLLGYLISCGPIQLPSPYEVQITPATTTTAAAAVSSASTVNAASASSSTTSNLNIYVEGLLDLSMTNATTTGGGGITSIRALYANNTTEWRLIENERRSWIVMQQALDIFCQRISVVTTAVTSDHNNNNNHNNKQLMRAWYEALLDIGSKTYL